MSNSFLQELLNDIYYSKLMICITKKLGYKSFQLKKNNTFTKTLLTHDFCQSTTSQY